MSGRRCFLDTLNTQAPRKHDWRSASYRKRKLYMAGHACEPASRTPPVNSVPTAGKLSLFFFLGMFWVPLCFVRECLPAYIILFVCLFYLYFMRSYWFLVLFSFGHGGLDARCIVKVNVYVQFSFLFCGTERAATL